MCSLAEMANMAMDIHKGSYPNIAVDADAFTPTPAKEIFKLPGIAFLILK